MGALRQMAETYCRALRTVGAESGDDGQPGHVALDGEIGAPPVGPLRPALKSRSRKQPGLRDCRRNAHGEMLAKTSSQSRAVGGLVLFPGRLSY